MSISPANKDTNGYKINTKDEDSNDLKRESDGNQSNPSSKTIKTDIQIPAKNLANKPKRFQTLAQNSSEKTSNISDPTTISQPKVHIKKIDRIHTKTVK